MFLIPGDLTTYLLHCHAFPLNNNWTNKASWKESSRWEQRNFLALKDLAQVSQAWSNNLCGLNISRKVKQTYWGLVNRWGRANPSSWDWEKQLVFPCTGRCVDDCTESLEVKGRQLQSYKIPSAWMKDTKKHWFLFFFFSFQAPKQTKSMSQLNVNGIYDLSRIENLEKSYLFLVTVRFLL